MATDKINVLGRIVSQLDRTRSDEFSPEVQRALRVDLSATLLLTAFTGLTAPFTGLILRRQLGATPLQLSVMASAGAACLLLSLAWVRLVDRERPLPYFVWPGFLARAVFLLVPFIHSAWAFIGVLVAATLLGTVQAPAQAAVIQSVYPREERGRALGTVRVTAAFLAIALSVAAGSILGIADYRWIFFCAALLGMASSLRQRELPVPTIVEDAIAVARPRLRDAWNAVREDREFRRLLGAMFAFGTGIWIQMPATPLMLADVVHASTGQVGVFAATAAIAGLAGNAYWGRFVDRRPSIRALRLVYLIGVLDAAMYYVAHAPWMLIPVSVSEAIMTTGLDLAWMMAVMDAAGPRRAPQYVAIAATLAGVRGVIGPLIGGAIIESFGVQAVYPVTGALMACAAWLVTRHIREADARFPSAAITSAT